MVTVSGEGKPCRTMSRRKFSQALQASALAAKRRELAGNLSGGQQQVLEMAVALILHPRRAYLGDRG